MLNVCGEMIGMSNHEDIIEAYDKGFLDALTTYSWMKDGVTYVGTCGTKLIKAQESYRNLYNYSPPLESI